jgi:2-amino-4-hydroxy-6-hydroxymethyldihydropteridine diphosphokinase
VSRAYVGLGSNLGDRERLLCGALAELGRAEGVDVVATSSFHDTEPVGYLDQPRFLNAVAALETSLRPRELLELLLAVERDFGRDREQAPPKGPRTLDLDLLLYDGVELDEPGLTLPHPRLHERLFVLEPLAELAPELDVPGHGPLRSLLARLHSA